MLVSRAQAGLATIPVMVVRGWIPLFCLLAFAACDNPASPTAPPVSADEHAVLVYLQLSDDQFGTTEERDAIHQLSDRLEQAIDAAGAGEFDGDEFGAGQCTLYMYGADADTMFAAVEQILRASRLARGGYVIKRYGAAGNPAAREVRVDL